MEGTWHTNVSVSPESLRKLPNDLSSLPKGIQTFDDVLFDIRGIVQLLGKTMKSEGGDYPERVDGIKIGKKFERLHVLHAAGWQTSPGTTIGTYILHYTDGSHEALDIIYGQHVLDWWRYAKEKFSPVNSTIAWVGSNALAKPIILSNRISQGDKVKSSLEKIIGISLSKKDESKDAANNPIRLFKTAWENPQPELEVVSIDYISKMTDSAPILVAMTVE